MATCTHGAATAFDFLTSSYNLQTFKHLAVIIKYLLTQEHTFNFTFGVN